MTVKELIEELQKMPQDAEVYTVDYGTEDDLYGYNKPNPRLDDDCVLL